MTNEQQKELGKILWAIADQLRGAMNADDFRDYMLSFLFLRYLSDNYEASAKKELGSEYPPENSGETPLQIWYKENENDKKAFEDLMRRRVHYVIKPDHLWGNIADMARRQDEQMLNTLQESFKFIENESFDSTFLGLFSEVNLSSEKLGKNYVVGAEEPTSQTNNS
jgi:type I restriction enzyme M protein